MCITKEITRTNQYYNTTKLTLYTLAVNGNTLPINNIKFETKAKEFDCYLNSILKLK